MKITVGIHALRRRFGHYFRLVEEGTTIVITRYGKPLAVLMPVSTYEKLAGTVPHAETPPSEPTSETPQQHPR